MKITTRDKMEWGVLSASLISFAYLGSTKRVIKYFSHVERKRMMAMSVANASLILRSDIVARRSTLKDLRYSKLRNLNIKLLLITGTSIITSSTLGFPDVYSYDKIPAIFQYGFLQAFPMIAVHKAFSRKQERTNYRFDPELPFNLNISVSDKEIKDHPKEHLKKLAQVLRDSRAATKELFPDDDFVVESFKVNSSEPPRFYFDVLFEGLSGQVNLELKSNDAENSQVFKDMGHVMMAIFQSPIGYEYIYTGCYYPTDMIQDLLSLSKEKIEMSLEDFENQLTLNDKKHVDYWRCMHAIAGGMNERLANVGGIWDDFKKNESFDVSYKILGNIDSTTPSKKLDCKDYIIHNQYKWLKRWINDSATTANERRAFFNRATGIASYPPEPIQVTIKASSSQDTKIVFSPYDYTIEIGTKKESKEAFIEKLKVAIGINQPLGGVST